VPTFPITKARAADAVPKGRIGYDVSADRLLLHTIQTEEAVDALLTTGVLVPDNSLAEPLYVDAYAWMLQQMARKLSTVGDGALWFWAKIRRQDLVDCCRRSEGGVLLTCKVPRERALLSHFSDWHQVLNESPLAPDIPGESDEELDARLNRVFDDFEVRIRTAGSWGLARSHWPEDLKAEVEQGWETILEPGNYGRFGAWQATMHELRADDVVEAVRLER
jgi:hypothetical protein